MGTNKMSLDKDLHKINSIVRKKTTDDKRKNYTKYIELFHITKRFIQEKNLILYGGLALNLSLPESKRFYGKYELPDYDFFSYSARTHAKELADRFKQLGYSFIEVRPGLHRETFKVFVELVQVADITDIPMKVFQKLHQQSANEKETILKNNPLLDIVIAPLAFLRLAMHIELSRPDGYIERWPKVYKRMRLFYSIYPVSYDNCENTFISDTNKRRVSLISKTMQFVKSKQYPILGNEAIKLYASQANVKIPKDGILDSNASQIEIISTDYKYTVESLSEFLHPYLEKGETIAIQKHAPLNKSEFIPKHYIITLKSKNTVFNIATVFKSQACYAFKKIDGINVLSIHAILSLMYAFLFSNRPYFNKDKIKCSIDLLLQLQGKFVSSKLNALNQFELQCYGIQPQLDDLKKAQWDKYNMLVYRP